MEMTKKLSAPVEGMTCASCVARVEKAISKVEGIKNVAVNLATEKATFEYDPSSTDLKKITELVEDAGYKISLAPAESSSKNSVKGAADEISSYEKEIRRDFLAAAILTIPIMFLNMGMMWSGFHTLIPLSMDYINKILLIITTPVILFPGRRFFRIFWNNLKHFAADMNSLVAIGTGAAYTFSLLVTLFPEMILSPGIEAHVYYDTTAVIITLILMGRWLEARAKSKTNSAVKKLLELKPDTAIVIRNGQEVLVKLEDLKTDDIIIVKPGGKIPADGIITHGTTVIDESMITGESIPVEKFTGSKVIGGTINKTGSFKFRITALGENSVLGQIIRMVEEAQGSKAPIQNLADKVAAVFVPVVIGIAILTFIYWFAAGADFNSALINFIAVLIIACPCALGLATPTAIMVGTGKGAQAGILIKNGESLELAHKISTVIFDKTGTITEGRPVVTNVITDGISEEELIRIIASVEKKSEHPVADAVVDYANTKGIKLEEPESFTSLTGMGVQSVLNGSAVVAGNLKLMNEFSVDVSFIKDKAEQLNSEGKTVIYINIDGRIKGIIAVEDPVKEDSIEAIKELKSMGIKTVMLTGDNKRTAAKIAAYAGLDAFEAEVMPEDKAKMVAEYQKNGSITAMVGDGINDAPALATSDVGIAIGNGTDVAIESGSIVLINGSLKGVVSAIKLSRRTIGTIKQNLFWAFIYNVLGIPLAMTGLLNPMFAALAMSFSSVSVVTNSLRLKRMKIK
jgi:P-type Cu+ transporter